MTDSTNETTQPTSEEESTIRRAKKGQDDDGQIVSGAAGELFNGSVADVTDGESGRKKK